MMSDNKALDPVKFDSKPLNGLRGILSIHLVLFHSILFSQAKINTYGQVSMSMYIQHSSYQLTGNRNVSDLTMLFCLGSHAIVFLAIWFFSNFGIWQK